MNTRQRAKCSLQISENRRLEQVHEPGDTPIVGFCWLSGNNVSMIAGIAIIVSPVAVSPIQVCLASPTPSLLFSWVIESAGRYLSGKVKG